MPTELTRKEYYALLALHRDVPEAFRALPYAWHILFLDHHHGVKQFKE